MLEPPPPWAEPLHWLTVAPDRGVAPGVSELMLLVIRTLQVMVWAESLPESLHWTTLVTRSDGKFVVELVLPPGHGSSEQLLENVTVELRFAPSMVLTTVTSHVWPVDAPMGPAPTLLHCEKLTVAALAGAGAKVAAPARPPTTRRATIRKRRSRRAGIDVGMGTTSGLMAWDGRLRRRPRSSCTSVCQPGKCWKIYPFATPNPPE